MYRDDHDFRPADFRRHRRQKRPVSAADVAAGRHGGPHPGQRAASFGHHGGGRGVPVRAAVPLFQPVAHGHDNHAAIGAISMLLASTMAMVSRDIKQVWAYSTISQLGFMIMGLAAGGYVAGVFHLTTHAGFKALLFLSAGVFIHAYRHQRHVPHRPRRRPQAT
jgi:hypothetical protein